LFFTGSALKIRQMFSFLSGGPSSGGATPSAQKRPQAPAVSEVPAQKKHKANKDQSQLVDTLQSWFRGACTEAEWTDFFCNVDKDGDGSLTQEEWSNKFGGEVANLFPALCGGEKQLTKKNWSDLFKDDAAKSKAVAVMAGKRGLKNKMLDILEDGEQIVVCGDTSVGKSTIVNFLLQFPINHTSGGIGTRRPTVVNMVPDPLCSTPLFKVTFALSRQDQDTAVYPGNYCTNAQEVWDISKDVNDHKKNPNWFTDGDGKLLQFHSEPLYITVKAASVKNHLRLVDLPGMTSGIGSEEAKLLTMKYLVPGNICVLVMGKDNDANAQWKKLAEAATACASLLCVQNFASILYTQQDKDKTGQYVNSIESNFDTLQGVLGKGGSNPNVASWKLVCVDFGAVGPGGHPGQPPNQPDWQEIVQTDPQSISTRMDDHEQSWSTYNKEKMSAMTAKRDVQFGLRGVLELLSQFEEADIGNKLSKYKMLLLALQTKLEANIISSKNKRDELSNPRTWSALMTYIAVKLPMYLDSTCSAPGDQFGRTRQAEQEKCQEKSKYWFKQDMDDKIKEICSELWPEGQLILAADKKLFGLSSWFRLLDELCVMFAFAPMACISKGMRFEFQQRIESSLTGKRNPLDDMVQMVCQNKVNDKCPVHGHLQVFRDQFLELVKLDMEQCLKYLLEQPKGWEKLTAFCNDMTLDDGTGIDESKILGILVKSLQKFASHQIINTIDGEDGDSVGNVMTKKAKSGLCVWSNEKDLANHGILHWLAPFPCHYLNGQIPWKELRLCDELNPVGPLRETVVALCDVEKKSFETLVDGTGTINAANLINAKVVALALTRADPRRTTSVRDKAEAMVKEMCMKMEGQISLTLKFETIEWMTFTQETLTVLRAMQGDISTYWEMEMNFLLPTLKSDVEIGNYIQQKIQEAQLHGEPITQQPTKQMSDLSGQLPKFLATLGAASSSGSDKQLTTEEERQQGGETMKWPNGLDPSGESPGNLQSEFLSSQKLKLLGEGSWRRLCKELSDVLLLLCSQCPTPEEINLVKSSCGENVVAGQDEMVCKLVQHRVGDLSETPVIRIFGQRLRLLYRRDVKICLGMAVESLGIKDLPDMVTQWFETVMDGFFDDTLNKCTQKLTQQFNQLLPVDTAMLNGRLPLRDIAMTTDTWFGLGPNKNTTDPEPEDRSIGSIKTVNGGLCDLFKGKDALVQGMKLFITAMPDGTKKINLDVETAQEVRELLQDKSFDMDNRLDRNSKPVHDRDDLESKYFHDKMLRLHKAMHAAAIDHCRPRLRAMMARCYKTESLMEALQSESFSSGDDDDTISDHKRKFREKLRVLISKNEHKVEQIKKVLQEAEALDVK